ncbi:MAG: CRISPR-associated protein Cas5 [Blastocatellia bacterium]|nr:CRISPR-associated protein Cas5 [Blastocatellia bacterium]
METIWLRVRAPFAAFRGFQAGVYRATSRMIPPSAAYGLVLNLAGIEMRGPTNTVTTEIRQDLPRLRIAVGSLSESEPEVATLYQQLHSYPVGASGKELSAKTHGAKFWIVPVRREILIDFDCVIGVQTELQGVAARIRSGLCGQADEPRYGLPFAGDNNLLIDRIEIADSPPAARWYALIQPDDPPQKRSCRLTVSINRTDNSQTTSRLYAPLPEKVSSPPETVWVWVPSDPA